MSPKSFFKNYGKGLLFNYVLGALLLLLPIFLGSLEFQEEPILLTDSDRTTMQLATSLERAKIFFKDERAVDSIGPMLLKKLLMPESITIHEIPKDNAFGRLVDSGHFITDLTLERTVNHVDEMEAVLKENKFYIDNYFYRIPTKFSSALEHPWDDILIKALYCDYAGYDDLDFKILNRIRTRRGDYYDTHNLLGLLLVQGNRCFDDSRVQNAIDSVTDDIERALNRDKVFSDLYAERVACMYWAGAGARVKPEWIKIIADAQRADGGWADIGTDESRGHPAGLAALSIKYFLQGATRADFYRPKQ